MKNHYSLLGVDRTATKGQIKKNYHRLATKYHPDKSADPSSAEKFIAITEAYDVLSNKKSRAQYDLLVWEKLKQKKESGEYFNVGTPSTVSTRMRRNRAQKKRSISYIQENNSLKKKLLLISESLIILGRYVLHLLGTTLLMVMAFSLAGKLPLALNTGIFPTVMFSAVICAILYGIFLILKDAFVEISTNLKTFSVFYKIDLNKTSTYFIPVLVFSIVCYMILLKTYF